MNIWFDTSPNFYDEEGECGQDCKDCTRPSAQPARIAQILTAHEIVRLRELTLRHTPELHIQPCAPERWLVCHPTGSGYIAVLDAQAMSLFSLFEEPTPVSHIVRSAVHGSQERIERAVALLYRLGFLYDPAGPSPSPAQEAPQTLTAWLHMTNQCNLRCQYCYVDKTPEPMPADVGRKAIDALFRSALKHHLPHIKLKYAGGEASLHMKRVIELHNYALQLAQKHGIHLKAQILSNGVALSQRTIEQLKAFQIGVTLSLDGLGADHDSQRPMLNGRGSSLHVLRTIDRLLDNRVIPHISVTVSRRNLSGLPALVHYFLERDLPFSLNYYRDNECSTNVPNLRFNDELMIAAMRSAFSVIEAHLPARSLLDSLLDKANALAPHQHTCGVGQNYLVIDQRGGVAKCQMEIKHTIATVDTLDPLQIIRDDRQGVQGLAVEEKEGCRSCEWRNWCTGGCPVQTRQSTGRYDVKSPNCNIYKALFPDVLRLEALRLLRYKVPLAVDYARSPR